MKFKKKFKSEANPVVIIIELFIFLALVAIAFLLTEQHTVVAAFFLFIAMIFGLTRKIKYNVKWEDLI